MKAPIIPVEYWDGWSDYPLTAKIKLGNRITGKVAEVFCNGQCHGLALAMHELTGWDVFGIYTPNTCGCCTGFYRRHVVVRSPKGKYVDIHGNTKIYDDEQARLVKDPTVSIPKKRRGWLLPNMVAARHFAPIVLEKINA